MNLSNSYFKQFRSISPAQSKFGGYNQNTNLNDNQVSDSSRLKDSISTRNPTQCNKNKIADNLYIAKLESKILQNQKKLDTQRYQIDMLTSQTQHYMKLCEEQKQQLDSLNIQILRQEYQQQIAELVQQKEKITELIYSLSQQYKSIQIQQQANLQLMKEKNMQLAQKIQQALNKKQKYLLMISEADKEHKKNQQIIVEQEQRMDELRNIQRKLFIALKQMQSLQVKQ